MFYDYSQSSNADWNKGTPEATSAFSIDGIWYSQNDY